MHPLKTRKPFTLFKKETKSGAVWYARFWDENAKRYAVARSTNVLAEGKKQRRFEAEQVARKILPQIKFTPAVSKAFIQYLENFWALDSAYVREAALVKKRPLSAAYIHMNHEDIRRHIKPFKPFGEITLQKLSPALIRDWITWMAERGLSGNRINHVLQGMRVAVRYAVIREELERDPFRNIGKAAEAAKEKGILTYEEAARLISAPIADPRHRLAVLLGLLCGMRMGEVRGLQWRDIENGLIHIRHNYINGEGVKAPKCKGGTVRQNPRTVPLPSSVEEILKMLKGFNAMPNSFVFESFKIKGKPVSKEYFRYVMCKEFAAIGISGIERKKRNLSYHGLRHSFITLSRLAGITDIEIRALAGHRSVTMTERYSHAAQVLDFAAAREKLERAVGAKTAEVK